MRTLPGKKKKPDSRHYAKPEQRNYVTGGSVMFRRACLEDVGDWDERFIMYLEDIDYSQRCRQRGWKLWYGPASLFHHHYHGSTSNDLCNYLCNRNRFLFIAKALSNATGILDSHISLLQGQTKRSALPDTVEQRQSAVRVP